MTQKRKVFLIFIGITFLLFFGPFSYFKANTFIETQNKVNNKNINGSTAEVKIHHKGISWNEKELDLKKDSRLTVKKSSTLNLVIYSKFMLELSFQKIVDEETIHTTLKAESIVWGLGKFRTKKNAFNKSITKRIDEIYTEN